MMTRTSLTVVSEAVARLTSIAGLINAIAEHKAEPGPHTDRHIIEAVEALDNDGVQVLLGLSGGLLHLMGTRPDDLEEEESDGDD